ncbi:MAG: glutamate--tRNA ligase [Actinobacteria bacterium]|nr:glutamate--tRNA ligase [Cyanobacteriota bacterium]MCL5771744.1 glutamate--tRNA ligase [Actinomycetota bacterium]
MEQNKPRFRFAPSPTGGLHIGTARTALFNWLSARSMGGDLILRIEDTDLKRSTKEYEESIINDLKWLGLNWDEFYRQSERLNLYKSEAERLLKEGKAYMCFCSSERLEALKDKLISEGKPLGYDNKCRNLSEDEINDNLGKGIEYTIRFKVNPKEIKFNDLIRGEIKFSSEVISDFVLIKSDGTPSYNFAVVVDDNDMRITHVLRGEDHITNTARQIMLFESLGYKIPYFAHLSMILGKDGAKLSKRHGSTTITQFKEEGYLNEAIANYLSLLSWAPRDGEEIFYLNDILNKFKISDISKNPAIFDVDKLNWLNGNYIRKKANEELVELVLPFLIKENIIKSIDINEQASRNKIIKCVDAFKDKIKTLAEFPVYAKDFFSDKISYYDEDAINILKSDTSIKVINMFANKLTQISDSIKTIKDNTDNSNILTEDLAKEIINEVGSSLQAENIKGKLLYMPIRASLTGKVHGPDLPKVISILGKEECLKRINQTISFLNNNKI